MAETFGVRSGAVDRGRDYEYLTIANITLNLISEENIKDFKISSNAEGFGDFDDVILELVYQDDTTDEYVIQLKHAERSKTLSAACLLSQDSGKYSIQKYFKSYKKEFKNKNSKMILYTNCKLERNKIMCTNIINNINVKRASVTANTLLNTSVDGFCTKFSANIAEQPSEEEEMYMNFFENFSLYTNQANSEKMEAIIREKFRKLFQCDQNPCDEYLHFIREWSKVDRKKQKLTKVWIRQIIALCLTSRFVYNPTSGTTFNPRLVLLQEAIEKFGITAFPAKASNEVVQIFEVLKNYGNNLEEFNKVRQKFHLKIKYIQPEDRLSGHELSLLLWLTNKFPLIIAENATTNAALKLYPEGKYIVIQNDDENSEFKQMIKNTSVFRSLSNLDKNSEIFNKLIKQIRCNLQGREISLEDLLKQNDELTSQITTHELLQMLKVEVFSIGEDKEELPEPHIQRNLSTTIIDVKFLKQIEKDDSKTIVVLSCSKNKDKIKKYLKSFDLVEVQTYVKSNMKISSENKTVFYHDDECSQEGFDKICTKNKSVKQCHHFRISDDGNLEWIKSKGNIDELEPFLLKCGFIKESQLYSLPPGNNINVICANPGIGKSTLTKSLKNQLPAQYWVIIINPTDVSAFYREKPSATFEEYIETKVSEKYTNFDKAVMSVFKKKKVIAYIWDGLDEIPDDILKKALEIMDSLSKNDVLQWITSRCHLKDRLETKFNVFSRTIQQFDEQQQKDYISKRLEGSCSTDLEHIIEKIRENIEIIRCKEVLGIPIQIYMLTELFRQDPEKYSTLLSNMFSLTDLYYHFVNEKFNRFYKQKANIENPNDYLQQILEAYKESYIKKYEKAAVKSLEEPSLQVDCSKFLTKIKQECDGWGLITNVSEDMNPTFVHNSYGEYFVACYLFKNYRKIDSLKTILFKERYTNIRFLFDLLMAKNSPVHIAVLYKNLQVLKDNEHLLKSRDESGRNPLHIACTWGQRYPLLNTTSIDEEVDTYKINEKLGDCVEKENSDYEEIINYLVDKCDHKEKDDLFQIDSSLYADTAFCLFPLSRIAMKTKLDITNFPNFKDVGTLLYYGIKFYYAHLLDLVPDIPMIKTEKRGLTLLHLCAEFNSTDCLHKLLKIEKYRQAINTLDLYDVSPASIACKKGRHLILEMLKDAGADLTSSIFQLIQMACKGDHHQVVDLLFKCDGLNINEDRRTITAAMQAACLSGFAEIVKRLVDFGADVNVNTRHGTPLYIVSKYGHEEIVKILLNTKKAQVNKANKFGFTPLHIACQRNYIEIVKFLLSSEVVDVNVVDNKGLTPLHVVSKNENEEMLQLLLDYKADVNKANKKKITALHISSQSGNEKIAGMLIKAGAQVNCVCSDGCTPVYLACENGHTNIVQLLLNSNSDIKIANTKQVLPEQVAETNNFYEIVRLLKDFVPGEM